MSFEDKLIGYKNSFESFLKNYLESLSDIDEVLLRSMEYSLFSGGKRIRPVLMLGVYEACGGKSSEVYKFASAIEMIHTYSLIHDDLPCMDNDVTRRGISCNHIKFGESTALLAGDALLTLAFEIISSCDFNKIKPEKTLKCIEILSRRSGCKGMVSGQCMDLNQNIQSKEELFKVYNLKTSCLISASTEIGAVLSGVQEEKILACKNYGQNIGLCFQIVDDILDKDVKNLSHLKSPNAVETVKELTEKAKAELDVLDSDTTFLKDFANFLMFRVC